MRPRKLPRRSSRRVDRHLHRRSRRSRWRPPRPRRSSAAATASRRRSPSRPSRSARPPSAPGRSPPLPVSAVTSRAEMPAACTRPEPTSMMSSLRAHVRGRHRAAPRLHLHPVAANAGQRHGARAGGDRHRRPARRAPPPRRSPPPPSRPPRVPCVRTAAAAVSTVSRPLTLVTCTRPTPWCTCHGAAGGHQHPHVGPGARAGAGPAHRHPPRAHPPADAAVGAHVRAWTASERPSARRSRGRPGTPPAPRCRPAPRAAAPRPRRRA